MDQQKSTQSRGLLILILGAMTALGPFTIDTYLPAFTDIAYDFGTTVTRVSLSLSSYFIGIAGGQLFYGPLLDRFGRKPPLYFGLILYVLTSLVCLAVPNIEMLIGLRFAQALGACVCGVAAMAMVRDLFKPQESAKVLSTLVLILGVSPLLAPTFGGYLAAHFGWKSIFIFLALLGSFVFSCVFFFLPESRGPDTGVSLHPFKVLRDFWGILKNPQFRTYAFMSSVAFSGLFIYLAGSPAIFLGVYDVGATTYGWIFAICSGGFIISSQLNVLALRRFSNSKILWAGLSAQAVVTTTFFVGAVFGIFNVVGTVLMLFLFLSCFGFINPNATSLVLAPFPQSAGRAAALLGCLQMGVGSLASMMVGVFSLSDVSSISLLLVCSSCGGFLILLFGTRRGRRVLD